MPVVSGRTNVHHRGRRLHDTENVPRAHNRQAAWPDVNMFQNNHAQGVKRRAVGAA